MARTLTITAKYPGTCGCGSRFAAGVKIRWTRGGGVSSCPACQAKVVKTTIDGRSVKLHSRAGAVVAAAVLVGSAEVAPAWLMIHADGSLAPLGGYNAMHNADLIDFLPEARRIAAKAFAAAA